MSTWIPALITALIGGLLVALLAPMIQTNYAKETAYSKRKILLWESIGNNFTTYIKSHEQLLAINKKIISNREDGISSDGILKTRKEEYRRNRDSAGLKLGQSLVMSKFYFGTKVQFLVSKYECWKKDHIKQTKSVMPDTLKFKDWRDRILTAMQLELKP